MVRLLQLCGISEEDLNILPEEDTKKRKKTSFKNDMIESLEKQQTGEISQMGVEEVRAVIDEYVNSETKRRPRYLADYIARLKDLNGLDLVTIIELVKKGDMQNTDVISFATENDIDKAELNKFINDDPQKKSKILRDFSNAINAEELINRYKEVRALKGRNKNGHEKAKEYFQKYVELFKLYKNDPDGEEIKKFLKGFKKQTRRDPKIPLTKEEIIYLYEIGLIGGQYAFHTNDFVNILNNNSNKSKKDDVDNTIHDIISKIIEDRKLRIEDAKGLFKNEIEAIFSSNRVVTKEMVLGTLLGYFFADCTDNQKIEIILSCDFSDEIDGKIIQWFLPNLVNQWSLKKTSEEGSAKSKDIKGESDTKKEKKQYIIIPWKQRYKDISSINIPDLRIVIENGILYAISDNLSICIIEQLSINKGEGIVKTGEHPTYVIDKDYYEKKVKNDQNLYRPINIDNEQHYTIDFSMLFKLYRNLEEKSKMKRILHRVQENNSRNIVTWQDGLIKAISELSGIDAEELREKEQRSMI